MASRRPASLAWSTNRVLTAPVLGSAGKVVAGTDGPDVVLTLPAAAPGDIASVVALELDGPPACGRVRCPLRPGAGGVSARGPNLRKSNRIWVSRQEGNPAWPRAHHELTRGEDSLNWVVDIPSEGDYKVEISYAAAASAEGTPFSFAGLTGTVKRTSSDLAFRKFPTGSVT